MRVMGLIFWRVWLAISHGECFLLRPIPSYVLPNYVLMMPTRTVLEPYFVSILQIILTRLQNSRTETLSLRFVRFYHFVSAHDDNGYGTDFVVQETEKVQQGYVQ